LQSPCLIIVGEVVRLRDELDWFDTLRATALPAAQAALESMWLCHSTQPPRGAAAYPPRGGALDAALNG
jgi:hypothetical protein